MESFLKAIDNINNRVGKIVSFLIFPIIGIIIFEVIMRYFLHASQLWVPEISVFLFGGLFVLGGGYTLLHQGHVRLDVLYDRFSPRIRAVADIITSLFFFIFCFVLIWEGWVMAWDSLITMEKSPSAFAPLLFPVKMLIPIGGFFLFLQGLVKFIRDISLLLKGDRA